MPIGNLKDMVSSADLDAARARRNPSEYEEGFGDDMNDDNFTFEDDDDGFDSLDGFGDSETSSEVVDLTASIVSETVVAVDLTASIVLETVVGLEILVQV